jgi:hypothetical protein
MCEVALDQRQTRDLRQARGVLRAVGETLQPRFEWREPVAQHFEVQTVMGERARPRRAASPLDGLVARAVARRRAPRTSTNEDSVADRIAVTVGS